MRCAEQAVSVEVRVDVDSAVVVYRPAAGDERASPAKQVSLSDLFHAAPWRTFRWYYFSAITGERTGRRRFAI
jgi:hypothetical protein